MGGKTEKSLYSFLKNKLVNGAEAVWLVIRAGHGGSDGTLLRVG